MGKIINDSRRGLPRRLPPANQAGRDAPRKKRLDHCVGSPATGCHRPVRRFRGTTHRKSRDRRRPACLGPHSRCRLAALQKRAMRRPSAYRARAGASIPPLCSTIGGDGSFGAPRAGRKDRYALEFFSTSPLAALDPMQRKAGFEDHVRLLRPIRPARSAGLFAAAGLQPSRTAVDGRRFTGFALSQRIFWRLSQQADAVVVFVPAAAGSSSCSLPADWPESHHPPARSRQRRF